MSELNICVLGDGYVKGVGDPDMTGWAGRLVKEACIEHGPINFYNLGIPNQTSVDIEARLSELEPRLPQGADNRLILSFGSSDTMLLDGKPTISNQMSVTALKNILIKTHRKYKILMIGPPPVYEPQRNARIKRVNSLYYGLCVKAHVPYIDLFSSMSDDIQYKRDLVKGGKVYPDRHGYDMIFDLIWNDRSWWFN